MITTVYNSDKRYSEILIMVGMRLSDYPFVSICHILATGAQWQPDGYIWLLFGTPKPAFGFKNIPSICSTCTFLRPQASFLLRGGCIAAFSCLSNLSGAAMSSLVRNYSIGSSSRIPSKSCSLGRWILVSSKDERCMQNCVGAPRPK